MRKIVISATILLLTTVALLIAFRPSGQYTITTPFVFPVIPEGERQNYPIFSDTAANFYWISDETIAQMSTEALLETYLTCPETWCVFVPARMIDGVRGLVDGYHYGVQELLLREDLPEVLLDRYLQIEVSNQKVEGEDYQYFEKESQDVEYLRYMEMIAACLNLDMQDKTEGRLFRAIERNYLLYARRKGFYQGASVYFFTLQQAEILGGFKGKTYKTVE